MLRAVPRIEFMAASTVKQFRSGILILGDLFHLLLGDDADLGLVRLGRPLGQVHGALDQHRHGRRLTACHNLSFISIFTS